MAVLLWRVIGFQCDTRLPVKIAASSSVVAAVSGQFKEPCRINIMRKIQFNLEFNKCGRGGLDALDDKSNFECGIPDHTIFAESMLVNNT